LRLLVDVVMEELNDKVDMGEDHAATAVALAAQLVKSLTANW